MSEGERVETSGGEVSRECVSFLAEGWGGSFALLCLFEDLVVLWIGGRSR